MKRNLPDQRWCEHHAFDKNCIGMRELATIPN